MKKYSIIIPIFNAEKTIRRCLQSVQSQEYTDYEVLMIDDGSTDGSAEICKSYEQLDSKYNYFYQRNMGPSAARNKGLDVAKGEYIIFLDSDDYMDLDYFYEINEVVEKKKPDVVFISYAKVDLNGRILSNHLIPGMNESERYHQLLQLSDADMFGYTWIKIFKRSCIGETYFRLDMNLFEDEEFTCNVMKNCRIISYVDKPILYYSVGGDTSLTKLTHQDYVWKRDIVFDAWLNLIQNRHSAAELLRKQANKAFITCKYYYLEHYLSENDYLRQLRRASFMNYIDIENDRFLKNLFDERWIKLKLIKRIYKLRIKIKNIVGRRV